jgi:hypothetical protein
MNISAHAEKINFSATIDRNIVAPGQSVQLSLKFDDSKSVPAPSLPAIDGMKSRYVGPSTVMSISNGRMSSSITHIYRLVPLKTGKFNIGPISFEHEKNTYVSNPLMIEVLDSSASRHPSPDQRKQQASMKDRLFLTMKTGKSKIYINEIIPLTIKLYVRGLNVRDIQYPKFSHEGFSAEPFGQPNQYKETRRGVTYDVVEFNTTIFGTKSGKFTLGPATMQANLVVSKSRQHSSVRDRFFGRDPFNDFFGRYEPEPLSLNADAFTLSVLPRPEDTRPPGFNGAVGNFAVQMNVSPQSIKAGDPVTLKTRVTGKGNFGTVTGPVLKNIEGFKTYKPETKQDDKSKTFEQILIPTSNKIKEVPEAMFSFFDPVSGKYRTITQGPFPLTITKLEKNEELTIMDAPQTLRKTFLTETLGRDIIYIKESPGTLQKKGSYLYKSPLFLVLQLIPLMVYGAVLTLKKRRDRLSTDISYARRLKAPRKAGKGIKEAEHYLKRDMTQEFYDAVFITLREYLGNRFHASTGGITVEDVDRLLKDHDLDESLIKTVKHIFTECDMARYAPSEFGAENRQATLEDLRNVIDQLERNK